MTTIDLDELERKARADALALDGLHGDPSKRGGWIGHRDHARNVVALIARIRELEAVARQALHHSDLTPAETAAGWAILSRGVVLP